MTISGGIFVLQQIYNKQVAKTWIQNFSVPPSFGWFAGGANPSGTLSSIERYSHTNDTTNTEVRTNLSKSVRDPTATNNSNYGWFAGGLRITPTPASTVSDVERLTFVDDTSSLSQRGKLSYTIQSIGVSGNENFGWFSGGNNPSGTLSSIQRIDYSSDTSTATLRGKLTTNLERHGGTGNQDYGWFFGGLINPFVPSPSLQLLSTIQRITYSSDTSTASLRGPLDVIRWAGSKGVSTNDFGWIAGGSGSPIPTTLSSVCRIDFNSDTQTASTRGSLTAVTTNMGYTNDSTYGWFTLSFTSSAINRIEFLNDTVTAIERAFRQDITQQAGSATGST